MLLKMRGATLTIDRGIRLENGSAQVCSHPLAIPPQENKINKSAVEPCMFHLKSQWPYPTKRQHQSPNEVKLFLAPTQVLGSQAGYPSMLQGGQGGLSGPHVVGCKCSCLPISNFLKVQKAKVWILSLQPWDRPVLACRVAIVFCDLEPCNTSTWGNNSYGYKWRGSRSVLFIEHFDGHQKTGYDPYLHVLVWPSLSIRYDWTRSSPCTNRGGNCSIPAQGQVGASQCTSMGISW